MDTQTATRIATILRKAADAIDQALAGNLQPAQGKPAKGLDRPQLRQIKLPDSLVSCRGHLDDWVEYVWSREGKLNPFTIEAQIIDLSRMGGPDVVQEAIRETMRLGLRAPITPKAAQQVQQEPPKKSHGGISNELMQRFLEGE